jgi:hypothetical protein
VSNHLVTLATQHPVKYGLLLVWLFLALGLFYPQPVLADGFCEGPFVPVSQPLTELGSAEYVRLADDVTGTSSGPTAFAGGLYPHGQNSRPAAHEAAGIALAAQIVPLNEAGQPTTDGQIVFISIGMSNTSSEFGSFQSMIHGDTAVNPRLLLVNGAQGGRVADRWVGEEADTWAELDLRLQRAGVTPEQVQVAWIKQTLVRGGDFPDKAQELQDYLRDIVHILNDRYPNLRLVYLSSRTRSYTYWRGLSPEPLAFETGFAVKWLIEQQLEGDPSLNFDAAQGEVKAPYLSWGPYLWIDGENPRADGRTWTQADMTQDCTHPAAGGNRQVAEMLYQFFTTDSTAVSWFLAEGPAGPIPTAAADIVPTNTPAAEPLVAETAVAATVISTHAATLAPTQTAVAAATPAPAAPTEPDMSIVFIILIIVGAGLAVGTVWLLRRGA